MYVCSAKEEFDGMSWGDFEALARHRFESLKCPLHRASVEYYDEGRLLWRLAEVIGRAAWQVEAGGSCPEYWTGQFEILARLHERLQEHRPPADGPGPAV